ncbi:MAG: TIGR02147 family protein [Fibrobacter sp.]|nr:TIGR02147 family protein [Fibrobacter sp.]
MVNLFEYLNYREFLRDAYEERHSGDWRFSHRYIAERAGFDSSMFNKILQGKRNLTERLVAEFADIFCNDSREKSYFADMVAFNQAKTHSESRQYLEKLVATKECKVEDLAKDQFEYFDHWYHAVVRELVTFYPYVGDDAALGLMVRPPITASQVKSSIALLERLSMIRKDETTGTYVQTQGLISSGSESYSTAVNSYIQQNLDVAQTAMDRFDKTERNLSTLAFACDETTYAELVEMVRRFRREVLAKVSQCEKPNRVFQLGMQLFPLSDPYPPPQRRGRKRRIRGMEQNDAAKAFEEDACGGDGTGGGSDA